MRKSPHMNDSDAYDSPWKEVLEHAFPEFMAFYFPEVHAQIDWARGHGFKDTELRQVVRDAKLGKRLADALVQITLKSGEQRWVYIHIEVQGQRDSEFARRMFIYNYRLFDRYAHPVASLAVLADEDEGWRPSRYGFEVFGCHHTLEFPVVKLTDYDRPDLLETSSNPFALVTAAHLRTRQTKSDPEARYRAKLALVRLLYRQGWRRQRILDLFGVIDWMMRLPDVLEQRLWLDIEAIEGDIKMPYVTSVERLAIQRGMQQGLEKGRLEGRLEGKTEKAATILERLLVKRFGPLNDEIRNRLEVATIEQLDRWIDHIPDAPTIKAVFETH
uniref:Transposase, YhgA-like n=1 Tax=Candidatus Kentrum sp. FM TaxID=2126340 RepID=A0A450S7T6_9GAMM|nr:MAG: Putative transposase, YhgA-like [Candidatus Kentron sp. FM]VFJ62057.1 MAG: Putative transposase, YhgA-like [Candidatus Kentron sp. FM]VFK07319.1 MAG: Putative transposase, YhgA-like [Candidatus Kentron sp. FM]VFK07903.1 MAG: Putative transposase, YhgA-like [Candidatus Kentron sp. FM]